MEINNNRKDWALEKLGDFADYEKGKKPKNQSPIQTDIFKYPYVNIQAFEKGIIDEYTDGEKCNFCSENDFLMVWDGSRFGLIGKGIKGAIGSTLMKINFPGIENHFAYYFLKSKYLEINSKPKGTGTPHVNPELLWNYIFPIAPLPEQRAIVSKIEQLFSDLDNGIENFKKARAQLKLYRQSVLKAACEGKLVPTEAELARVKGRDYEAANVGQMTDSMKNGIYKPKEFYAEEGFACLRMYNIDQGKIVWKEQNISTGMLNKLLGWHQSANRR